MSRSVIKDIRLVSSLTILLSAVLIGGTLILIDYSNLQKETQHTQESLLSERKSALQERVERSVAYIQFFQKKAKEQLQSTIKARTNDACDIAAGLVWKYQKDLDQATLEQVVRDSLRNIRFNNGRGYFFAINVSGIEELFADKPHLEGKDLTSMQDSNGQYVVKDMLKIARESGEGFYQYTWTKPGNERDDNIKIAYVKYLPELDWVIGTGDYLEDVEKDLQQEVLDSLHSVYSDPSGENYLFIGTWDGLTLSGPATGKNMLEVQDSNGLFIVKELISKAKEGGGFVQYVMPKLEDKRPAPKLSYVAGIPEWRWYIGSGEYIDNIESALLSLEEGFYEEIKMHFFYIAAVTLVTLILNFIIINVFAGRLKRQISRFVEFFQKAATQPIEIDLSTFFNSEFKTLGSAANTMLQERNRAQEELAQHQEQLENLVSERTSELKAAQSELIQKERLATLGKVTATVSHELRNPLGTIQSAIHNIEAGVELSEQKMVTRSLQLAERNIDRCVNIIEDLNNFTRVKKLALTKTKIDDWLKTLCEEQVLPEGINCDLDFNSNAIVQVDQDKLLQAIMNLVTNAIHALTDRESSGNKLLITTHSLKDHYEIKVSDNGIGMSEEVKQKIFEPLYSTKGFGVGLGMVITKSIIEQHRGSISIESSPGKGTTATLRLPYQP